LIGIPSLEHLVKEIDGAKDTGFKLFLMEFALHGLAEYSMLSKHHLERGMRFKDLLSSMFSMPEAPEFEDEDEDDDDL
jgi:magnesium chelatase subunit I